MNEDDKPIYSKGMTEEAKKVLNELGDKLESSGLTGWYILDDAGEPVRANLAVWALWCKDHDRSMARDTVGEVLISTVFLGLDHSMGYSSPVLFETMVFGGKFDQECERYQTREAALAGHARWVLQVKETA